MKDIPIFVGQTGTASLILREIPYKGQAFVLVRSVLPGGMDELLAECRFFCLQAGAKTVFASADEPLAPRPHVHDVLELCCRRDELPPCAPVPMEPVTEERGGEYLTLYNELFRDVANAATCTRADLERIAARGSAYFAVCGGEVAGLGEIADNELRAVAVRPEYRGLGRALTLTLLHRLEGPELTLLVSSSNRRALRLYEGLGFRRRRVLSSWYLLRE